MTATTPSLRGSGLRRAALADRLATAALWAMGGFVLVVLGAIILHFVLATAGFMSLGFVFGDPSGTALGGVGPMLWNSLYMLVLTMLISAPLSVLAGIYMAEYAGDGPVTSAIRFAEEAISSIPSIVVGLFGLILFVDRFH